MRGIRAIVFQLVLIAAGSAGLGAVQGEIVAQQTDAQGDGYIVLRVWGTHYEMGYAHGNLLADEVVSIIQGMQANEPDYAGARTAMAGCVFKPDEIEQEFQGILDGVHAARPDVSGTIDLLDLKVGNTQGDWAYVLGCRSHSCWGSLVQAPVRTLSTRRLDYYTIDWMANLHVVCAWDPSDGSPEWVNLAWAGGANAVTAVNEYGNLASLHDHPLMGAGAPGTGSNVLPRCSAGRYVLTMDPGPDLSAHLDHIFGQLQAFTPYLGSFHNLYVPDGYGGVLSSSPASGFYKKRVPQASYYGGEVLITTNEETDGTSTDDAGIAAYYDAGGVKTLQSHWDSLGSQGYHKMSVAYRGRRDMTLWCDGILAAGRTARIELEWSDLFPSGPGNEPPTVATAASASPSTVTGTTTDLSVLGDDDGGEANLTYTWSSSGPASATFGPNGTNAAKSSTATFGEAGAYDLTVTIADADSATVTSQVRVTVEQTLTSIDVSPPAAAVALGGSRDFDATALDQFGDSMASQPGVTWSVDPAAGTVDGSGLFTASDSPGGPYALAAEAAGGLIGTASVTVTDGSQGGTTSSGCAPGACSGAGPFGLALALAALGRRRSDPA